jgi:ElaB/YqjD/DUF883 family membrane-anchored ribosome-binding protein
MAILDKVKSMLRGKGDKAKGGIEKVAKVVDDKTKGKYSEKIENVTEKAKDVVDKLDEEGGKNPPAG